jgi:hypothetical protein
VFFELERIARHGPAQISPVASRSYKQAAEKKNLVLLRGHVPKILLSFVVCPLCGGEGES